MFKQEWLEKICSKGSEVALYFLINEIGGVIFRLRRDLTDGSVIDRNGEFKIGLQKAQLQFIFAVSHTTRFGVTQPLTLEGGPSTEYRQWFAWWYKYVENLPDDDFNRLSEAISTESDQSSWRPAGDWHNTPFLA